MQFPTPYTTSDLFAQLGDAIDNRSIEHLNYLMDVVNDWIQSNDERNCQVRAINAAIDAVDMIDQLSEQVEFQD